LYDCPLLVGKDGLPWCGLPGRVVIDKTGKIALGSTGKPLYEACIVWRGRATKNRWTAGILQALHAHFGPHVLLPPAGRGAP
jgi:hypothetical protein